jgi:hypothetical protein
MSHYHNYSFAYYTKDNRDIEDDFAIDDSVMRNLTYSDNIRWQPVLRDFLGFLSAIYGYDISKKVAIHDPVLDLMDKYDNSGWDDDEEESA